MRALKLYQALRDVHKVGKIPNAFQCNEMNDGCLILNRNIDSASKTVLQIAIALKRGSIDRYFWFEYLQRTCCV